MEASPGQFLLHWLGSVNKCLCELKWTESVSAYISLLWGGDQFPGTYSISINSNNKPWIPKCVKNLISQTNISFNQRTWCSRGKSQNRWRKTWWECSPKNVPLFWMGERTWTFLMNLMFFICNCCNVHDICEMSVFTIDVSFYKCLPWSCT